MSNQAQPPQRLSPTRTYPAKQPNSRGRSYAYPVPRLDMPTSSALTRVRTLHRTCLVPRPCSTGGCRICPAPSPDMFGSLTPQQVDSFWGLEKPPPHAPQLVWSLTSLANTLKHSLLSSNLLSLKLYSNLSFLR
jgi:hypothetical protein